MSHRSYKPYFGGLAAIIVPQCQFEIMCSCMAYIQCVWSQGACLFAIQHRALA